MQFFNPSILLALLALLIPIIVHLFKLRKFKKENFTNVAFLKKVEIESRKSAQLKKWLVLLSRLLLFASLIFAFAKPYIPIQSEVNEDTQLVVYIDNSFSMQAIGKQGTLLEEAKQSFVNAIYNEQKINYINNTNSFNGLDYKTLKNEVLTTEFTSLNTSLQNKIQRAKSSVTSGKEKRIVIISDFEDVNLDEIKAILDKEKSIVLVQLQPEIKDNTWIEKVNLTGDFFNASLSIEVKTNNLEKNKVEDLGISILNGEEILARKTVNFVDTNQLVIEIPLPSSEIHEGIVQLESKGLNYDKEFFFSLNKPTEIEIVHLYENHFANFIERIFNLPQFLYQKKEITAFDFSELKDKKLVILDNLSSINKVQQFQIINFITQGGSLVLIPSSKTKSKSYNELLTHLEMPLLKGFMNNEMNITSISDWHPLFKGVFEKKVENFDYPTVKSYFKIEEFYKPILAFSNGEAFLINKDNVYAFTANIHSNNSTIYKSPLIVPVFYQIGLQTQNNEKISLTIESEESSIIQLDKSTGRSLKLASNLHTVIPNQQKLSHAVKIFASHYPSHAGNYKIIDNDSILGYLSFNYKRNQSDNQYLIPKNFTHENFITSVKDIKQLLSIQPKVNELWQRFLIFALFFMLIEFLILRFIK